MAIGDFHLRVLQRISGLLPEDAEVVTMFVTSTHWAAIAEEVEALIKQNPEDVTDPSCRPTPANFKELRWGKLLVVNSGSEDQAAVNLANQMEAERTHFDWRRNTLRTG
jgi:hypothetical protein